MNIARRPVLSGLLGVSDREVGSICPTRVDASDTSVGERCCKFFEP